MAVQDGRGIVVGLDFEDAQVMFAVDLLSRNDSMGRLDLKTPFYCCHWPREMLERVVGGEEC